MKHTAFTALALLCLPLHAARAQGDLVPAGPPAPTMKTLQQIEPRGDVNRLTTGDATAQFVITAPGSYFLSGDILVTDLRDGIRIEANDVSLDLRGFRVSGEFKGINGIVFGNGQSQQTGVKRCIVRNGIVTGWTGHGVHAEHASQCLFRDLIVSANAGGGLIVNKSSVSGCITGDNGDGGIRATKSVLTDCFASTESTTSPAVSADESQLSGLTINNDTLAGTGLRLLRSTVQHSTVTGCQTCISAVQSQVRNCNVSRYGVGITADRSLIAGSTATNGLGGPDSAFGILAASDCQILENMLEDNRFGIDITGSYCRVERNHVSFKNFVSTNGVAIRTAIGTPGRNIITLNNITGFLPGFHHAEIEADGGDHAPIAGFGAPADANYLQPVP